MAPYVIPSIARFFATLYPYFLTASLYGAVATLILFAISALFRASRGWTGRLIIQITYIWGLTIWLSAAKDLYHIWGARGLTGGLVLFLLGVIPVAGLAMVMTAHWLELGSLVLAVIVFSGVRAFASKINEHAH